MNHASQPGHRPKIINGTGTPSRPTTTARKKWTAERIRALGAATNVTTAAEIFGLSRDTAYQLARAGQFPVPVLRVGRQLRVPVAPILALLGLPAEPPQPGDPPTPSDPPTPQIAPHAAGSRGHLPGAAEQR